MAEDAKSARDRATRWYVGIDARLIGLSISSLEAGQKSPPEPLAERRRFEGMPGPGKVGIKVFCVSEGGEPCHYS
jgi:hypothetical protein